MGRASPPCRHDNRRDRIDSAKSQLDMTGSLLPNRDGFKAVCNRTYPTMHRIGFQRRRTCSDQEKLHRRSRYDQDSRGLFSHCILSSLGKRLRSRICEINGLLLINNETLHICAQDWSLGIGSG
jgi:hypothetical protein